MWGLYATMDDEVFGCLFYDGQEEYSEGVHLGFILDVNL
jgi:hypothetical protein